MFGSPLVRFAYIAVILAGLTVRAEAAVNILFVTTNNGSLTSYESGRKSMLESYGYTVNTIWDGAPQATFNTAFTQNRAIYLPDEATAAEVGYKLREATIGILSEHPGLADELGFCSGTATTTTASSVNVTNNAHYVMSVFSTGSLSLGSSSYSVVVMGGTTAAGGQVLATVGASNSVVAIEAGATLANTYNASNVAFGRRVQFPLPVSVNNGATFSANTYTLANRMLRWAAGLDKTLIVRWKLDETSGTLAADSSGFGVDGSYTGSPTLGVAAVRRLGTTFAVDGKYVTAPAAALLNSLGASNDDFSVAFWVRPNTLTGGWRPLLHKGAGDFERGPGVWLNPGDNRVHFCVSTSASNNEYFNSNADLPTGSWSHVACVKAGTKWRCYVNGVLDTEATLAGATTGNSGPLYVGDDPWYSGSASTLDDVRVYTGALTTAEVQNLYGLVGHWKLDESAGTTAADASPASNTGTYTNGVLVNQAGVRDAAATFDGTDDYVGVADSASLKATDAVTIAAWIRPTASANIDRMIVNKEGEYEVALTDANEIKWGLANTSPGWSWHQTGVFVPNDAWSHIVVTYDGVEVRTYLNGQLVETYAATGNITDIYPSMNELRIGGRSNVPSGKCFAGSIDDVYVYTREVNAAEVAAMYGLVGYWKFAEGTGSTAADSSGCANAATLSGGATWESDCVNNKALQTDGISAIAQTASVFQPPSTGTVAFWMRGSGPLATRGRLCGVNGDWEIRQETNGTLSFDLGGSPYVGNEPFSTLDAVDKNGRWYHIVATFNDVDNTYAVYINGELRTSGTSPVDLVPQTAAVLMFGVRAGTTEYFKGAIRDFRVYNRRILPTEIAALYGMMGRWKLVETMGTTAADSSQYANNGTYTNGVSLGTSLPVPGYFATSAKFDGLDDYVSVPNESTFDLTGPMTVAVWVRPDSLTGTYRSFVSKGDSAWQLRYRPDISKTSFRCTGLTADEVLSIGALLNNRWWHVAGVYTGSQLQLYINGALNNTTSATGSIGTNNYVVNIGRNAEQPGREFNGAIYDARVYNRALCPDEISYLYGTGFTGIKIIKWEEIQ